MVEGLLVAGSSSAWVTIREESGGGTPTTSKEKL